METMTRRREAIQHRLSAAFPAMAEDEFELLKEDIANYGVQTPVVMFEGLILDGMHRWRAATELNLFVPATVLADGEDPVAYVLTRNLYRRHMTASQRAFAVVRVNEFAPAGRPTSAKPCTECKISMTNAEMAEAAQTSVRTIGHAKEVHRHGSDELKQAAQAGTVSVRQAAQMLKSNELTASPALTLNAPAASAVKKLSKLDAERRLRNEAQRRSDVLLNLFLTLQARVLRPAARAPKADERQLLLPHFERAPR